MINKFIGNHQSIRCDASGLDSASGINTYRFGTRNVAAFRRKDTATILLASVSLLLSACGGSSSSDPTPVVPPVVSPVVEQTSTEELKRIAAGSVGRGLENTLNDAGSVINQNDAVLAGTTLDVLAGGADSFDTTVDTDIAVDSETRNLIEQTLALGDAGARTSRDANVITIDPDEAAVCDSAEAGESQSCLAVMEDLDVQLVVTSDVAGTIAYRFQQQPLMTIGYAPDAESFELNLAPFRAVAVSIAQLEGIQANLPETFSGSVQFATNNVLDEQGDPQSSSVSVDVTRPIDISDAAQGVNLDFAIGTLFSIDTNSATGSGGVEFNIGALQATFEGDDGITNIDMPGFTARADVSEATGQLTVSNLGLERGPLRISVGDEEILRLAMEAFGFSVSESTDALVLTDGMNIEAFLSGVFGGSSSDEAVSIDGTFLTDGSFEQSFVTSMESTFEILSQTISLTAPEGSSFARAGNGSLMLTAGGPLAFSEVEVNSLSTETNNIVLNVGECFGDRPIDLNDPASFEDSSSGVISCTE